MRKLNYMMADFKLRVDHITYDATKKLDALKEDLRPVKPIPPSHCIAAPANERQRMLQATRIDFLGQRRLHSAQGLMGLSLFDPSIGAGRFM